MDLIKIDNQNIEISIVTPVYNTEDILNELYIRLKDNLEQFTNNFEIIMVNDASPDNSWEQIQMLAKKDKRVKGFNLSRNFGQHHAITAGLNHAKGNWIVIMDCDLQDNPEEIPKFYKKAKEGYDIVIGKRVNRKDNFFKIFTSKIFYKIYNYLTDHAVDNNISSFGIYSKKVIANINKMKEQTRSFGLFAYWVGFSRIEIDILHSERSTGISGYNLRKRINLATDSILAYSNKPLKLVIKIGFLISFISFIYAIWLMFGYFIFTIPVPGYTSLIVSIYFLSGLIISIIGMVGLYIGKIFDEVKDRPLYIIESTTLDNNRKK